jgi:hypothetical protein
VLDEAGVTCPELQVQARSDDNWIQLEFSGEPGERFSLKLALGDVSITEDFVILVHHRLLGDGNEKASHSHIDGGEF